MAERLKCTFTKHRMKKRPETEDGHVIVKPTGEATLYDENDERVAGAVKLGAAQQEGLRSLGWLGGDKLDDSEVKIIFGDDIMAYVLAKDDEEEAKKRLYTSRTNKYKKPTRCPLQELPQRRRSPRNLARPSPAKKRPSPPKKRPSPAKWGDDLWDVQSVASSDDESFEDKALKLAREDAGARGGSTAALYAAASKAALAAPEIDRLELRAKEPERKPERKRPKKDDFLAVEDDDPFLEGDDEPADKPAVDRDTARAIAEEWIAAKTRSIETTYDNCWRPTNAQRKKWKTAEADVFADRTTDDDRLRAQLADTLNVQAKPHAEKSVLLTLIDLVCDSSVFSYRQARDNLEDAQPNHFVDIARALDRHADAYPRAFVANVRTTLAKARDGSLVDELRAEERDDGPLQSVAPSASRNSAPKTYDLSSANDDDDFDFLN